jgi:hypothetical protein
MRTAAQPVATNGNGKFDPSTWAGQARSLARNEADASALLWGVILAAGTALSAAVALMVGGATWRDVLSAEMAAGVGVQALAVSIIWMATYATSLRNDTREVRVATWRQELALGVDLDGDGQVGQPQPVGHVMKIGGSKPREVVLPDLDPPRETRPLVRFPVPANDVIYVLTRAAKEGLGFREWDGHRLPSGATVDRNLWTATIDGMVAWEMVQATTDAAGRRRVRLAGDATVDEMIDAVRQSVAGRKP